MTTNNIYSSLSNAEAEEVERALGRYVEIRWGDWKQASPDTVERRLKEEKARLESFTPFLSALSKVAEEKGAEVLLYPGAGLDLISALMTRLPKLVLVDPTYSPDDSSSRFRSQLETLATECIDQEAHVKVDGELLRVEVEFLNTRRELLFVPGTLRDINKIEETLGGESTVYLVKGTAQPALLLPSPRLDRLNPRAWGIHFPSGPSEESVIYQMYEDVLFSEQLERGELTIFETYLPAVGWHHLHGQ